MVKGRQRKFRIYWGFPTEITLDATQLIFLYLILL